MHTESPLCPRYSFAQGAGMIAVEITPAGIRVTIPTGEVVPSQLDEVLSWLRLESVTRRSAMSEAEADAMAESGKAQWWAENKSRFIQTENVKAFPVVHAAGFCSPTSARRCRCSRRR